MKIHIATTDAEVAACYPAMRELRPHVGEERFLHQVQAQYESGYRLAYLQEPFGVVSVAGFRIMENLAWGRFLYVDDLVTLSAYRSKAYGTALLAWLADLGRTEGCAQLHLDSGSQRKDAHRFYQREGLGVAGYHFSLDLLPTR